MFSKVSVAGALLLESHSWYLTQVLSRSSMKPFSWELQGVEEGGEKSIIIKQRLVDGCVNSQKIALHPNAHIYTDIQTAEQGFRRRETQREMSKNNISDDDIYENKTGLKVTGAYSIDASAGTDLRIARDTFCFQGLSLRMPMPKPERKNSSPVVTRSHFCEASNSSTAESQMKACSLLWGGREG